MLHGLLDGVLVSFHAEGVVFSPDTIGNEDADIITGSKPDDEIKNNKGENFCDNGEDVS